MAPVLEGGEKLVAFIGIQADVTEIREDLRMEQERQKLEALGRLSANISHEIKNAVQPVKLMSEMLVDWESLPKEQMEKGLNIIHENIHIADRIIHDVLRFSRKTENYVEDVAADLLADDLVSFTQNLLNSRIRFTADIEGVSEDAHVCINQNQFQQVVMNLVNNALYAMDEKGDFTLKMEEKALNAAEAGKDELKAGDYLCISFADSGPGIDEKVLASIFDPFFSTKPVGEGTGLGLSISYRLVRNWGGILKVQSKKGHGSTFSILLPIV